jgi:hypothetical protein
MRCRVSSFFNFFRWLPIDPLFGVCLRDIAMADGMRFFIRHGVSDGLTNTRFRIVPQLRESLISNFGKPDGELSIPLHVFQAVPRLQEEHRTPERIREVASHLFALLQAPTRWLCRIKK